MLEAIGKDFIEFWDYAASKGLVKKDWATTLRSAAKQVLVSVEPDDWERLDLRGLDIDAFVQRFERLRMGDLKPDSLAVYGKRFRNARTAYLEFLDSPSTWQFGTGRTEGSGDRKRAARTASPARAGSGVKGNGSAESEPQGSGVVVNDGSTPILNYPYPLRPGLVVSFSLPTDLTKHEAKRLASYLDSLALDPQLALPAGPPVAQGAS